MLSGLENPVHLLILLTVVLLLFGARRLPEISRSVGSGMREFKEAIVGNRAAELSGHSEHFAERSQNEPTATGDVTAME